MAEQLITKKYKMSYPSETKLIKFGFKKVKREDDFIWKYTFPAYKHNKITTIECVITIEMPSGKVTLDTYSNGKIYTPFYGIEYGNYEVIMNIINSNILREFSKLGIKEKRKKK